MASRPSEKASLRFAGSEAAFSTASPAIAAGAYRPVTDRSFRWIQMTVAAPAAAPSPAQRARLNISADPPEPASPTSRLGLRTTPQTPPGSSRAGPDRHQFD